MSAGIGIGSAFAAFSWACAAATAASAWLMAVVAEATAACAGATWDWAAVTCAWAESTADCADCAPVIAVSIAGASVPGRERSRSCTTGSGSALRSSPRPLMMSARLGIPMFFADTAFDASDPTPVTAEPTWTPLVPRRSVPSRRTEPSVPVRPAVGAPLVTEATSCAAGDDADRSVDGRPAAEVLCAGTDFGDDDGVTDCVPLFTPSTTTGVNSTIASSASFVPAVLVRLPSVTLLPNASTWISLAVDWATPAALTGAVAALAAVAVGITTPSTAAAATSRGIERIERSRVVNGPVSGGLCQRRRIARLFPWPDEGV